MQRGALVHGSRLVAVQAARHSPPSLAPALPLLASLFSRENSAGYLELAGPAKSEEEVMELALSLDLEDYHYSPESVAVRADPSRVPSSPSISMCASLRVTVAADVRTDASV